MKTKKGQKCPKIALKWPKNTLKFYIFCKKDQTRGGVRGGFGKRPDFLRFFFRTPSLIKGRLKRKEALAIVESNLREWHHTDPELLPGLKKFWTNVFLVGLMKTFESFFFQLLDETRFFLSDPRAQGQCDD